MLPFIFIKLMPEIWLGYGDSEIILDIKYENLLKNIKPEFTTLDTESISNEIKNKIPLKNSTLILIIKPFHAMMPILEYIQKQQKDLQLNRIEFDTLSKIIPPRAKRRMSDKEIILNKLENTEILDRMKKFDNTIILDKLEYDPFFGYTGIPVKLLRFIHPNEMSIAFSLLKGKLPQTGIHTEQLNLAIETTRKLNVEAVHVIADNNGINSIFSGDIVSSFNESIRTFKDLTQPSCDVLKSAFISGNSSYTTQYTLSESLNLLWNNYHAVREQGTIVLLSENRGGIGNGALLKQVENRLMEYDDNQNLYINDLEHINFINILKEKYEIILISTLPSTYIEKLGMKSISKIEDGLKAIIEKYGKYSKSTVVNNSEITFINGSAQGI